MIEQRETWPTCEFEFHVTCEHSRRVDDPGNPSATQQDEHTATHIYRFAVGESTLSPERCRNFHTSVAIQIVTCSKRRWTFFVSRKTDSELMTVLNVLACESGCAYACAVDEGPGPCPASCSKDWGGVLRQKESRTQNGHRACNLCVKHGSVPSKDEGSHSREFVEVLVSQHGCN